MSSKQMGERRQLTVYQKCHAYNTWLY